MNPEPHAGLISALTQQLTLTRMSSISRSNGVINLSRRVSSSPCYRHRYIFSHSKSSLPSKTKAVSVWFLNQRQNRRYRKPTKVFIRSFLRWRKSLSPPTCGKSYSPMAGLVDRSLCHQRSVIAGSQIWFLRFIRASKTPRLSRPFRSKRPPCHRRDDLMLKSSLRPQTPTRICST